MNNALIAIDKSKSYRVYLAVTTNMVQQAASVHDTTPVASAALGRTLTGAGLMGIMLKDDDNSLTLNFKGDGPAEQVLATAYGDGRVKGYIANPYVELPLAPNGKLDVGGAIGIGNLTVVKDIGLKDPYTGTIALVSGEIADDLTTYFYVSEQQNSSVALGVRVERDLSIGAAGGMIIQMMPGAPDEAVDALEEMLGGMSPITTLIMQAKEESKSDERASLDEPKSEMEIARAVFDMIFEEVPSEFKPEILEEREIKWQCDCSHERMARALAAIGRDDLREIIEEDGQAELQCHFCRSKYMFNREQLQEILDNL